ncbi:MAG: hypothetical protein IIV54_02225 [Bacteroidaceae bacterium]|nr:hypothetical protein [Bacteroidaceae bacterium]
MKKIFTLMAAFLCLMTQAWADKVVGSTTLPENGRPEHIYTMRNGNSLYCGKTTAPTETEANYAQFAFYAVDGKANAFYIYNRSNGKWLTYDKASSYSNCQDFVKFADSKASANYFIVNNYSGDNYEIQPVTTYNSGNKYLNWYKGKDFNPVDGSNTLGLWEQNGNTDAGSRWLFSEVVYVVRTYTVSIPDGATVTIEGKTYGNGDSFTYEGSLDKSAVSVNAPAGKFSVVSIDDVNNKITVNFATLPTQGQSDTYTNAWVYPKQQDNVGAAEVIEEDGVYTLKNRVLAASYMKVGGALYFAGSNAMNLVAGTEPFTVAFGNGDNVPASAMTLKNVTVETLTGNNSAIGGAEHYDGKQLVANYEYTYKGAKIEIVWRAVLRDGSHYLRTEMELKGVNDVDMFNVIPMIYNVDTKAAGSTPKVVGNTRGAVLMSDKIFAGLETPTAYNTVGEATGDADPWNLVETKPAVNLTASSWQVVNDVPNRVIEACGASYPNVLAYTMANVTLKKGQKVETTVTYTSGNHRLNFGGADLLDATGNIAASHYHSGYSGGQHSDNSFTFNAPYDGTFSIRVFVENRTESIDASSKMEVKIYEAKEGVSVSTDLVSIQGRWSRNTTLAAGETWKVASVVGLVAQDGKQADSNIHNSQKRRSFLAYSERERAVPWRAFPHYNSWYELNIDRNNAAPGQEHTNFTEKQVLNVIDQWKKNYFDKYGEGIAAFVIDDGWDNYGTWTFHSGFPNEMREIAKKAKELNAGIGAWLGPVGGYGQSGNYRRSYWNSKGGMQLSNPAYYQVYLDAARNLVCQQDGVPGFNASTDSYLFFKYDGISGQFSAVGPDAGDTGNENAEGIIRLERYVRENMREDIFFNTTVGTWASPFWYQISDATWRQEADYGEAGNNSIDREKWITYRDRLVHQNYVTASPICPINTLMTHGFILTKFGAVSKNMSYSSALNELRAAFVCGSGMVELYADYELMNSINGGALWADLAECVAWQKKNADVLADAHWVGGNPWTGSQQQVYGWASWNGEKSTLALRNGANNAQTYTFTLREALNIPANITGSVVLNKSFKSQAALQGLTEGAEIDIDKTISVTLPASSIFAFDGVNSDPTQVEFKALSVSPNKGVEAIENIQITFNAEAAGQFDPASMTAMKFKKGNNIVTSIKNYTVNGAQLNITLTNKVTEPGEYTLVIPEGLITRKADGAAYSGNHNFTVVAPVALAIQNATPAGPVNELSEITLTFNKEVEVSGTATVALQNAEGTVATQGACSAEGKVVNVTLNKTVTAPGEYTLVIPEGVVTGKELGDAFSGEYKFTVVEVDKYEPRHTGTKTRNDRNTTEVKIESVDHGVSSHTLTADEQSQDYTDLTATVVFKATAGETVSVAMETAGSWIHSFVYVDVDADGFTASIAPGSNWEPAGDLVSYSFYNNDSSSDESGWNSVGQVISGNNRNRPALPAFTVPAEPGKYRMRFKQDWCNIDPMGDADGKFDDFKQNGGQIVDVTLEVVAPTAISGVSVNKSNVYYDLSGRRLNQAPAKGVFIWNNKKVIR